MTNLVILTGNLGADVDVRESNGTTYARFSVATNYRVRAKDGDHYEDRTNWTRVTAFGGLAKTLQRLGKGSKVLVQGRLKETVYEKDDVRVHYSEVIATRVEFLVVKPPEGADDLDDAELPEDAFDPGAGEDEDVPL